MYLSFSSIFFLYRGVILLVVLDILVVRKFCGFKGYLVERVCFKCFKRFFGLVRIGRDFFGFERENWL